MVRIVRERNERSLTDTGLPFLFESTCSSIFARLEDLAEARAVSRVRLIVKLRVHIRFVNIFETEARAKRPPASMQRRIVVGVGTIERGRGQVRGAEVCYRIRGVGSNGG